jgi:hypothetical protein
MRKPAAFFHEAKRHGGLLFDFDVVVEALGIALAYPVFNRFADQAEGKAPDDGNRRAWRQRQQPRIFLVENAEADLFTGAGNHDIALLAVAEYGVRGVRLNLLGVVDFSVFGGPAWKRVFGEMAELGWHLEVQCEGERFAALLSVLHDLPRSLALVIDHFGLPDPATSEACTGVTAILRAARIHPVHIKLSAPYRTKRATG